MRSDVKALALLRIACVMLAWLLPAANACAQADAPLYSVVKSRWKSTPRAVQYYVGVILNGDRAACEAQLRAYSRGQKRAPGQSAIQVLESFCSTALPIALAGLTDDIPIANAYVIKTLDRSGFYAPLYTVWYGFDKSQPESTCESLIKEYRTRSTTRFLSESEFSCIPPISETAIEQAVAATIQRPAGTARAKLEIHLVLGAEQKDSLETTDANGARLHLAKKSIITNEDVVRVQVSLEPDLVHYAVTLKVTDPAAQRLRQATGRTNAGGPSMAILLDDRVLLVAFVRAQLSDSLTFGDHYTRAAATCLAERLAP